MEWKHGEKDILKVHDIATKKEAKKVSDTQKRQEKATEARAERETDITINIIPLDIRPFAATLKANSTIRSFKILVMKGIHPSITAG